MNNLKQLGLALANYESAFGCFPLGLQRYSAPGGVVSDFKGAFYHLLPYVDSARQYDLFNFDFTTRHNSRNSTALLAAKPAVFICPSDSENRSVNQRPPSSIHKPHTV